jgi:hypothetical protein
MPEGEEEFDESGTGACEAEGGHEKNEVESRAIGRRSRSARLKANWPRVAVIRQLTPKHRSSTGETGKAVPTIGEESTDNGRFDLASCRGMEN